MSQLETLAAPATATLDIQKSHFVAHAEPLPDVDAARERIRALSNADASHNGWAWRFGQHYRSSDDGEPSGSTGRPILQAIDGQQLDRVVVVVSRWFGGIKLGVGGLVRAYGGCAAECLRLASRSPIVEQTTLHIRCDYAVLPLLLSRLGDHAAQADAPLHENDGALLRVNVPVAGVDALTRFVADLSRGRARVDSVD